MVILCKHNFSSPDGRAFYERAGTINNILLGYLKEVTEQKKYLPQAFRTCRGIMSLKGKYGLARLVAVCAYASDKSIVLTSQLAVDNGYDAIGAPAVADAVLDRIVHTAHRIELTGESVRKMKLKK